MNNEKVSSDLNLGILHVEIEEVAVAKLRSLAEDNGLPLEEVIQGAIKHGLPLLGSTLSVGTKAESRSPEDS